MKNLFVQESGPDREALKDVVARVLEDNSDLAVKHIEGLTLRVLRSPELEKAIRQTLLDTAKDLAAEALASRIGELEGRVRAIVDQQFESVVAQVVRERLEASLREVRAKMSR